MILRPPCRFREQRGVKPSCRSWRFVFMVLSLILGVYGPPTEGQTVRESDITKYKASVSDAKSYPTAEQGTIASYLGIEETWHDINQCGDSDICPDVFLFDKPVRPHHNLGFETIGHVSTSPTQQNMAKERIVSPYNEDEHGTALAGIISARRVDTGVIGVNPTAHIFSLDWDYYRLNKDSRSDLTKTLGERIARNPKHLPIMVFATDWEANSGPSFSPCSERQKQDVLANFLVHTTTPLIIAAAGQVDKGMGMDIDRSYPLAPENMGDCENVIVVTACLDCNSTTPKIPSSANYSTTGIVQIAAYGDSVLTTGSGDRLTVVLGGTSPAAAFVAGVASAMVSRWPNTYKDHASLVKFRLQVSSTPNLRGVEALKVSAGILNASLAFEDPERDYLSTVGEKNKAKQVQGWCVDQIEMSKDDGTPSDLIGVSDIYRVYCAEGDRCTIYHADTLQRLAGVVLRSGPGKLVGHVFALGTGQLENTTHREEQVLFKADGRLFTSMNFTDLMLHDAMSRLSAGNCTQ